MNRSIDIIHPPVHDSPEVTLKMPLIDDGFEALLEPFYNGKKLTDPISTKEDKFQLLPAFLKVKGKDSLSLALPAIRHDSDLMLTSPRPCEAVSTALFSPHLARHDGVRRSPLTVEPGTLTHTTSLSKPRSRKSFAPIAPSAAMSTATFG